MADRSARLIYNVGRFSSCGSSLSVVAFGSQRSDPGIEYGLRGDFSRSNHASDLKIGTPVATLPGVVGSALGLFGPVSVYCDWVR